MIKTEEIMRQIGLEITDVLNEGFPKPMGFALIVFEFNEPGIANYVSNGERESMIKALKETVERLEKGQDIPAVIGEA